MPLTIGGLCPLLQVFDMPRSLAFYRDVLGFTVMSPVPDSLECDWVLLELNGSELMLNTAYESGERPAALPPERQRAHADVALFFDCPDLEAAAAHLRDQGVAATGPATRDYGMRQVSFTDPDGYEICLQHPIP
jgi:catechol 2,3-dioxygenase-like lactoylglutathione lyase family enzyme